MHESHNASISAISNSFHIIIVGRNVSAIFVSRTEAISTVAAAVGETVHVRRSNVD